VPEPYRAWGDWGDVLLTFPFIRDPEVRAASVDVCAFVPPRGAHRAFAPSAAVAGDVTRSAAAAERVKTGTELTSAPLEKEFGRCAEFLLKAGVDVNAGDADGVTALCLAARYGLLFVMRKLLARGADAAARDSGGNNALHWAKAFAQGGAADILAEGGADAALEVENAQGQRPRDVWGRGLLILPASRERDLVVPRVQKKSSGLVVSVAL
jgi:ankyrin repeat protein